MPSNGNLTRVGCVMSAAVNGNLEMELLDSFNSMEGLSEWVDPTHAQDQIIVDFAIDADPILQATGI